MAKKNGNGHGRDPMGEVIERLDAMATGLGTVSEGLRSLTANLAAVRKAMVRMSMRYSDHERRLRALEAKIGHA